MLSEDQTRVIFKKEKGSTDVIAFLLDVPSNWGNVVCYAHVGQHSEASLGYARECKPAAPAEYADLKRELEVIGYSLVIRRKFPSGFVRGGEAKAYLSVLEIVKFICKHDDSRDFICPSCGDNCSYPEAYNTEDEDRTHRICNTCNETWSAENFRADIWSIKANG